MLVDALSNLNSGIMVRLLTLKLAESVFSKTFPPIMLATDFLSLKYSVRRVKPKEGVGSTLKYNADPHQLSPVLPEGLRDCTVPLYPILNLSVTAPVITISPCCRETPGRYFPPW